MGLMFHMYQIYLTTNGSSFKSVDHPGSLNCQCDLVSHSSPTMDPFSHGETLNMIFSSLHDIYFDISEPNDIFYRFMKVFHQIGKKIHGLIHDMTTTHEEDFVESFDVIRGRVYRDIF